MFPVAVEPDELWRGSKLIGGAGSPIEIKRAVDEIPLEQGHWQVIELCAVKDGEDTGFSVQKHGAQASIIRHIRPLRTA
ncbi:hypothetical protein GCM10011491_44530 [Brucella endophytica]|uniref:Uncharacterized protein n=1 Tax=Brucella endophytica TaxID=1963359 RepID=A0A916SQU5_9HYPH|nr:hypothetical protein GCM10011491_44530 [Brucella endophytica]